MGNEASLEGGEGPPPGLPEGLAPDGKGGFVRVSDGSPVNLAELSEEQRRQLAAAVSRAQGRQPGGAAAARRHELYFQTAFIHFHAFGSRWWERDVRMGCVQRQNEAPRRQGAVHAHSKPHQGILPFLEQLPV